MAAFSDSLRIQRQRSPADESGRRDIFPDRLHRTIDTITLFDRYLEARELRFDAMVIGGAALNLLGVISRLTKDCDILFPEIPKDIARASQSFARKVREKGGALVDEWLNNGLASLQTQLLPGWKNRLHTAFDGQAIRLRSLGREDLLCAKLFALCDRGIDLLDCVALAPSQVELDTIVPWLEQQDANPQWQYTFA